MEKLARYPGSVHTFLVDGERAPRAGEWFRNPELASTFRTIAEDGIPAFYGGELGRRLVDGLAGLGGFLTYEDLGRVRVEWVDPVGVEYEGYRLYELPPPGQGIAALQMLRLLDGIDLRSMGHNSVEYLHHLIEAKKIAYADLAGHVADPDYMRVAVEDLLADDYIEARRILLDPRTAAERVDPGEAFTESETIYLAAADAEGNMVSFINSIFGYFGSGVSIPGLGFALQNRGAGFTLEADHPNTVAPGKRPFHTLVPAFATRLTPGGEEPWMAFGVMGGGMQPQGHVQVLLNQILFGMDPQEANDAARFQHSSGATCRVRGPCAVGCARRARLEGPRGVEQPDRRLRRLADGGAAGAGLGGLLRRAQGRARGRLLITQRSACVGPSASGAPLRRPRRCSPSALPLRSRRSSPGAWVPGEGALPRPGAPVAPVPPRHVCPVEPGGGAAWRTDLSSGDVAGC